MTPQGTGVMLEMYNGGPQAESSIVSSLPDSVINIKHGAAMATAHKAMKKPGTTVHGTRGIPAMKAQPTQCRMRSQEGFQLVELLITVLVISILSTALIGTMASMYQLNTASHNQALATMLLQEVIDNSRNMSWSTLTDNTIFPKDTWINLVVNQTGASSGAPTSFPRPLLLDMYGKNYSAVARGKLFRGTVRQKLQDLGSNQLRLTIEVSYPVENSGKTKTVSAATTISQYGLHN